MEIYYGVVLILTLYSNVRDILAVEERRDQSKRNMQTDDRSWSPESAMKNLRGQVDHLLPEDVRVGCKALKIRKYISDGFCTSIRPITDVLCTGHCLPIDELPWYAEFVKLLSSRKIEQYRCVNDYTKRKRVRFVCQNGEIRHYPVRVVKSCKCKKYHESQNRLRTPARGTTRTPKQKGKRGGHKKRLRHENKS